MRVCGFLILSLASVGLLACHPHHQSQSFDSGHPASADATVTPYEPPADLFPVASVARPQEAADVISREAAPVDAPHQSHH